MEDEAINNQEGALYVVGTRGYSAYEVAVLNGFEGTEEEWLASLVGPQGETGPDGPQGNPGPTGLTPSIRVGSVTTGEPGTDVIITITGTPEVPIINFTLPKGAQGATGESRSTNYSDLSNKPQIAGITLEGNLSLVELGIQPAGSYLTSDDLTNYVTNTSYAEWNKGGVVKTGNGFDVASNGIAQCGAVGYSSYQTKGNTYFISKGTLEAVFTGKGFLTQHQDLSNYISKSQTAGLVKNDGTIDTNTYLTSHQDISGKLDTSKVKNTTSTTAGDVYDVTYINTMLGNIESLLGGI